MAERARDAVRARASSTCARSARRDQLHARSSITSSETSTSSGVTTACEYLADQGLIGKASTPVRLTKRSNVEVQELAFYPSRSSEAALRPASAKPRQVARRRPRPGRRHEPPSPCRARASTT